eukprot:4860965-Ditylum_brightwellii.AAC.1
MEVHSVESGMDQITGAHNLEVIAKNPSRISSWLLTEAQLNGAFDYNCVHLAPPGTKVLIHEKLKVRQTWDFCSMEGWCIGPAPYHYWCYKVHVSKTWHNRIANTMEFFPKK